MATTTPDAAVIIPHYNDVERLTRCLTSIMANDRSRVEVIVVDNASTVPMDAVIAAFPEFRFVTEPQKGAAAARNRGVRETSAPLLFFIDADCVAEPDWIATALKIAPGADLIGGRVDVFHETPGPASGAEGFEAVFAFNNRRYVEKEHFSVTANLLTSRKVFAAVGDFIPGVSEDVDWCQRAHAAGYRIEYADELRVSHPSRSDWAALRHKWVRLTSEMFKLNGRGTKNRLRWFIRGLAMPVSALMHAPAVLRSDKLSSFGERLSTLGTLFRLRCQRMAWMVRQALGGAAA